MHLFSVWLYLCSVDVRYLDAYTTARLPPAGWSCSMTAPIPEGLASASTVVGYRGSYFAMQTFELSMLFSFSKVVC